MSSIMIIFKAYDGKDSEYTCLLTDGIYRVIMTNTIYEEGVEVFCGDYEECERFVDHEIYKSRECGF